MVRGRQEPYVISETLYDPLTMSYNSLPDLPQGITPKELTLAQCLAKSPNDPRLACIEAGVISNSEKNKKWHITFNNYFQKPSFQLAYQNALINRLQRMQITEDKVMSQFYQIATLDKGEIFNVDGTIKQVREMPRYIRQAISKVDVKQLFHREEDGSFTVNGTHTKLEFYNGLDALKELKNYIVQGKTPENKIGGNTFIQNNFNGDVFTNNHSEINLETLSDNELNIFRKALDCTQEDEVIEMRKIEEKGVV